MADEGGLKALSMRKLAASLDVEAMSLYNHVQNKDDVLGGMVEAVVGAIRVPFEGATWKEQLRVRCVGARAMLVAHPWAAALLVSRVNDGPNLFRYVDATLGCLRQAGFSWPEVDAAWNTLDSFVYGYTLQELNFPIPDDSYAETAAAYQDLVPETIYPNLSRMSDQVMTGAYDGKVPFEYGLQLILDGLERKT